jgi:hypothetical protein
MSDHARELLSGRPSGKYSPLEVAQWLEGFAAEARRELAAAGRPTSAETRRLAIDVDMQIGLAGFFAEKFRAGVLFAIHSETEDREALEASIAAYRRARAHWALVVERAAGVYAADLSASDKISNRGQWADRLPAIDADIAALTARVATSRVATDASVRAAVTKAQGRIARPTVPVTHTPPVTCTPGPALALEVRVPAGTTGRLFFRRVNQAERFQSATLVAGAGGMLRAEIPTADAGAPYPLQYYFELTTADGQVCLSPGFGPRLTGLPYHVVRRA